MITSTNEGSNTTEMNSIVPSECTVAQNLIQQYVEHAAHLLPAQGPITVFVHHNTLHAFENLKFDEAVKKGGQEYGCHPFLPEDRYREKLNQQRIRLEDLEAVLIEDLGDQADKLVSSLGTRFHLRMSMLQHPFLTGSAAELRWFVANTDALQHFREEASPSNRKRMIDSTRRWVMRDMRNDKSLATNQPSLQDERIRKILSELYQANRNSNVENWSDEKWESFTLQLLWRVCRERIERVPTQENTSYESIRHRDLLLEATGEDSDRLANEFLIRFCAGFLDQGISAWSMPEKNNSLYQTFLELYRESYGPPDSWLEGVQAELNQLINEKTSPLDSIEYSLTELAVEPNEQEQFIHESLQALRGWAGMVWQMETNAEWAVKPARSGALIEFLAVKLILERFALRYTSQQQLGYSGPLNKLRERCRQEINNSQRDSPEQRAFLIFQLAQIRGWNPEELYNLPRDVWKTLIEELDSFSGSERRRIYHRAFERRYRHQTLDAVAVHVKRCRTSSDSSSRPKTPDFQVVCCIDDREESFRRHIEEIAPNCETFGVAGFFGIAIYYRGVQDAHFSPLCPVSIKPQHYIQEEVVYSFEEEYQRQTKTRQKIGRTSHRIHMESRSFLWGAIAALFGTLASFPLVARVLFPRTTAQILKKFGQIVQPSLVTQLRVERAGGEPGSSVEQNGFTVPEMADIVERVLRDIGLTSNWSRLIVITGHGSSSMNNPHAAAYDCGACGGAKGGPNARAFAQIANDPRVREILKTKGLELKEEVFFIGAYHNTCDDSMTYYDLERLPASHKADYEKAKEALNKAREMNAHERCRRFESASLALSSEMALRHVEGRAEDLSQTRSECGHATNALCFVGRREWSRGLFLDRRAFLQSYDPSQDDEECSTLTGILQAVVPVCGGINLEYYFSFTDPHGYGCGTKLPHNITSLLGVMDGALSDLRPGLPWQMVEIHEPVRLLFVIECRPEVVEKIMKQNESIARIIQNGWVQLATLDSNTGEIMLFTEGRFEPYLPETTDLAEMDSSADWYRGCRDHLGFASIKE